MFPARPNFGTHWTPYVSSRRGLVLLGSANKMVYRSEYRKEDKRLSQSASLLSPQCSVLPAVSSHEPDTWSITMDGKQEHSPHEEVKTKKQTRKYNLPSGVAAQHLLENLRNSFLNRPFYLSQVSPGLYLPIVYFQSVLKSREWCGLGFCECCKQFYDHDLTD